jgi:hypothetical protein
MRRLEADRLKAVGLNRAVEILKREEQLTARISSRMIG